MVHFDVLLLAVKTKKLKDENSENNTESSDNTEANTTPVDSPSVEKTVKIASVEEKTDGSARKISTEWTTGSDGKKNSRPKSSLLSSGRKSTIEGTEQAPFLGMEM